MSFFDSAVPSPDRHSLVPRVTLLATGISILITGAGVWAQSGAPAPPPPVPPPATVFDAAHGGPTWNELSAEQQKILSPLSTTWGTLPVERKYKWLALAKGYPTMGPAEQEKLQSRMVEWAALKPKERERARLNFAETKKLPPAERNADWETYQALSPEEKQKLAAKAAAKPAGAAVAVKPVDPSKLTTVPLTRHTSEQGVPVKVVKPQLDRNTLLPRAPTPKPVASTPAN